MKRALAVAAVILVVGVTLMSGQAVGAAGSLPEGVPVALQGWVAEVSETTLILDGYTGQATVVLTENTLVGDATGAEGRARLEVGKPVVVGGILHPSGEITALSIHPVPRYRVPQHRVSGRVLARGQDRLLVEMRPLMVQVIVGESTRLVVPGVPDPTLEDITISQAITALGQWEERAFQARVVIAHPRARRPAAVAGFISEVSGNSVLLETERDTVTVMVTDRTRILLVDNPQASIANLQAGMEVRAIGMWEEPGVLTARLIAEAGVRPPGGPRGIPHRSGRLPMPGLLFQPSRAAPPAP